jgi:hypothetical protein
MNGEILNAMARLGGQYAAMGIYADRDDWQDQVPTRFAPCCNLHSQRCEPPGDLCCRDCTEAAHDTFPIRHADGSTCVMKETR